MALNWDLQDVENHEDLWIPNPQDGRPDNTTLNSRTQALIWATISIGMGIINEDTWKDFYARCKLLGIGSHVYDKVKDKHIWRVITPKDIKRHMGLNTNVIRMTDREFLDKAYKDAKDEC